MAALPIAARFELAMPNGTVVSSGIIEMGYIKGRKRFAVSTVALRPTVYKTLEEAKDHVKAWAFYNVKKGWTLSFKEA